MYIPKHFDEPRVDVLHKLMRARPLATLVTLASDGLNADHIPLLLAAESSALGTLRGHVARANPLSSNFANEMEVLAIFHGPDAYVTPSWYPTKAETGKAVPTWNYAVAHAYGTLRVIDDATWIRGQIETLTAEHENAFPEPWRLSDAPPDYAEKMMGAVVGIEIVINRLCGKWKVSQNQPPQNRAGVIAGLHACGGAESVALAAFVQAAGKAS